MIDNTFVAVMLASSLACVVTTIGIYVISKYEAWGRGNTVYFMSFAAGYSFPCLLYTSFPNPSRCILERLCFYWADSWRFTCSIGS